MKNRSDVAIMVEAGGIKGDLSPQPRRQRGAALRGATMLVRHLDRFGEWEDRDLNSRHHTLDRYRQMTAALDEQPKNHDGLLNLAGVRAVLAA